MESCLLPEKPKYFNIFNNILDDSDNEQVVGENNYIEIDSLPFESEL